MTEENRFDQERVQNIRNLEEKFPSVGEVDLRIEEFVDDYDKYDGLQDDTVEETEVQIAGRVTRMNDLNGIIFVDIEDETEGVQVILERDNTSDFESASDINIWDILYVTGRPGYSSTEEFSIFASDFVVATPSLRHPPGRDMSSGGEFSQVGNKEMIRERSMALNSPELNQKVRDRFQMENILRDYLRDMEYLEVRTPALSPNYAGGDAEPFETYSEALDEEIYLRGAPELALKKMVVGGFDRVFEIANCFRNESIDTTHNPEFTLLEIYQAYADYKTMMGLTEDMISHLIEEETGSEILQYNGHEINFSTPWKRKNMEEIVREEFEIPEEEKIRTDITELYDEVEDSIIQPTFVTGYPEDSSPLCRTDGNKLERFEVVVAGMEIANSYSELRNPLEQEERMEGNEEYTNQLAYGLPPTGGLGLGLDRIAMLITNSSSIKEVIPFPQYRTD